MTEREALRLALEALEEPHPGIRTSFTDAIKYREKLKQAITAIKEALAQPEREIDPSTTFDEVAKGLQVSRMAIAALDALTIEQRRSINEPLLKAQLFLKAAARVFKEALAQPEQEPVAHCTVRLLRGDEFYPKTEIIWVKGRPVAGPLYTTPPQRTWVGLTDEEFQYCVELKNPESIAEEVEAKLKEKNT